MFVGEEVKGLKVGVDAREVILDASLEYEQQDFVSGSQNKVLYGEIQNVMILPAKKPLKMNLT